MIITSGCSYPCLSLHSPFWTYLGKSRTQLCLAKRNNYKSLRSLQTNFCSVFEDYHKSQKIT